MIVAIQEIFFGEQKIVLTNQKALFWETEKALILSDLHVGKAATFRKHGIPISKKVLEHDLDRLYQLLIYFNAEKLIVVGDLFHAEYNSDITYFKNWVRKLDLRIELIVGNHDRQSKGLYQEMNFTVFKQEKISHNLLFVHDEESARTNYYTISGHTHPGVLIRGRGKQYFKLPCFQVGKQKLILPAFSNFTGLNTRRVPDECNSYACTDTEIFKI